MGHPNVSIITAHFGEIANGEVIHPDLGCARVRTMDPRTNASVTSWIGNVNQPARAQTMKQDFKSYQRYELSSIKPDRPRLA